MQVLPDIDEVQPKSTDDSACLDEIRQVLIKHGATHRFGISLLHQHFDVGNDEILVEECDPVARTLVIKPRKASEMEGVKRIETNWRLDSDTSLLACVQVCSYGQDNRHTSSSHL
jgi:hypothetical protein